MEVEHFMRYQGKCYDVGTKLKFKIVDGPWVPTAEGVITGFGSNVVYFKSADGSIWRFSNSPDAGIIERIVIEIFEPVYYVPQITQQSPNNRTKPFEGDIQIGWIWYIIIMVVGAIFKDRLLIWIAATASFFLWKNGYFNGGKK